MAPHGSRRSAKSGKRSLDAFAIATEQNPDGLKLAKHRLGQEEGARPSKRRRADVDEEENVDDDQGNGYSKHSARRRHHKPEADIADVDRGSDSEGHEWVMGHVASEDDSELDSDEAMGESDEERFQGFSFRGSTAGKVHQSRNGTTTRNELSFPSGDNEVDLDEPGDLDAEDDDDSLGEDAVDLATMLDRASSVEGESGEEDEDGQSSDSKSDLAPSDDEYGAEDDPAKLSALQRLIESLPSSSLELSGKRKYGGSTDPNEGRAPSEYALTTRQKLSIADMLPSISDPRLKRSLKILSSDKGSGKQSKQSAVAGKLEAPLPRRQQDRLDREAAYQKSKETLNRWIDTVTHNRRADHLSFPLRDPEAPAAATDRLPPVSLSGPINDLETKISSILQESGLAGPNGGDNEDKLQAFEQHQAKKLSLNEVRARRAELRMARELLFREEVRTKRIKKIKSKSYRRVHRKEKERADQERRRLLDGDDAVIEEDEDITNDRRRAEERMGARHRDSRWAKQMKKSGRTIWDEEAKSGVGEMARRGDALRLRMEGRNAEPRDGDDSDLSDDESHEDENAELDSNDAEDRRILRQLGKLDDSMAVEDGPSSKIMSLKFLQRAEARRKAENDEAVEQLRQDLNGDKTPDETNGDISVTGRRVYGLHTGNAQEKSNRFEEAHRHGPNDDSSNESVAVGQDADSGDEVEFITKPAVLINGNDIRRHGMAQSNGNEAKDDGTKSNGSNIWMTTESTTRGKQTRNTSTRKQTQADKSNGKFRKDQSAVRVVHENTGATIISQSILPLVKKPANHVLRAMSQDSVTPSNTEAWKEVSGTVAEDGGESSADEDAGVPFARTDQDLIKRAFAGDDVEGHFELEKAKTMEDEDEKIVDKTLPGWGSWVGDGISKKQQRRNAGRFLVKKEGLKKDDRKDAKLERVIINEKRIKKNVKYLATSLPHPFETKQQYERSLRLPVGPEWTTKETFQNATKPRVMVKRGRVIEPMKKPLL